MKKNIFLIVFALCLFVCDTSNQLFAQGATCADATQLCDDPACGSYEIGSGQGNDTNASGNSSCLGSAPNATWFFLVDDQGGGGAITIANTPACDTDFAAWGPFASPADALAACAGGISTGNEVGCDFTTNPGGVINMPGTSQVGDVYLMVITNFSDDPGIDVNVTAPPLQCCPVATGAKADVVICAGDPMPTAAIGDFEGAPGEISGSAQFITDSGLSTSATALVAPTAADFENATCAPIDVVLYYLYECDADCDGAGDGPSNAGSFTVTVYPDATTFVATETPGACGTAAMVSIATAGGTVCFTDTGNVPADLGCNNTDVQDLNYIYDPAFPSCNMMFIGTVAAQCVGTGCGCADPCFDEYDAAVPAPGDPAFCLTPVTTMAPCDDGDPCTANDMQIIGADGISVCGPCTGTAITPPIPTATCPPAELNFCDGVYDCMFSDANPDTDGNGTTDAPIITGSAAGATSAAGLIDLTQLSAGVTYTLTLNYEENGCFGTPITCTFTLTVPNDAEGGGF